MYVQPSLRNALALHLGVPSDSIHPGQLLERDLGLDPLDVVFVLLQLDELADVEFPAADLDDVRTVGDLGVFVRAWVRDTIEEVAVSRRFPLFA